MKSVDHNERVVHPLNQQQQLFGNYELDSHFDEMLIALGEPRPHYKSLYERLLSLSPDQMRSRQSAADIAFLNQGITYVNQ